MGAYDQPASDDMPAAPDLCNQATVDIRASVLGCVFNVTMPNEPPFVELGESFVAAMEATLATGFVRGLAAHEPKFSVTIRQSDFCEEPFEFSVEDESDCPHLTIACRKFDPDEISIEQQKELKRRLAEMVALTIGYIVIPDEQRIEELFRDDAALSRAIDFTSSFQVIGYVLGKDRKRHVSSWISETDQEYQIGREQPWDAGCPRQEQDSETLRPPLPESSRPEGVKSRQHLQTARHSKIKTLSLTRVSLWDKAEWNGLGFVVLPDSPLILALLFGKREPARQIFSSWKRDLGEIDESEALRISIIRHIDKHHPHHYRVVLGSNVERAKLRKDTPFFTVMQRVNTMTPNTSQNLDSFLEAYRSVGAFCVAPAVVAVDGQYPEPIGDFSILKRELIVREAWEIGINDIDGMGLLPDDEPFIPDDVSDAPVNKLLELMRDQSSKADPKLSKASKKASLSRARKEKRKREKRKRGQTRKSRRKK